MNRNILINLFVARLGCQERNSTINQTTDETFPEFCYAKYTQRRMIVDQIVGPWKYVNGLPDGFFYTG